LTRDQREPVSNVLVIFCQRSEDKTLKTYRVYIEQINQQYYDVKANSRDAAIPKAEREWKKENGPCCRCVEEQDLK